MNESLPHPKTILVAEECDNDFVLLSSAFQLAGLNHHLFRAIDGVHALTRLQACSDAGACPDLLILDAKMPKLDGFDVLTTLRERPELRPGSAIMLSGSISPADRDRAVSLGAHAFLGKPQNLNEYIALAGEIDERWLSSNKESLVVR
jgi:CheY-like chemotaxis protein